MKDIKNFGWKKLMTAVDYKNQDLRSEICYVNTFTYAYILASAHAVT
jgi:hypothetical protein